MRARAAGRTASVDVLAAPELLDVRLDGRRVQGVSIGDLGLRLQKSLERGLVVADRGVSAREAVIHGPRIRMELCVELERLQRLLGLAPRDKAPAVQVDLQGGAQLHRL